MPSLAGEAAVRIVPSLKGFHAEAERKIKARRVTFDVYGKANMSMADAQVNAWRAAQNARPLTIPVRTDYSGFKRDLSQVEHIFERNSLSKGLRLQVKILGLDALPALAYAAGSAASGLDALAKSALVLPGIMSAAGAGVAALAVGISGVQDAFKEYGDQAKNAAKNTAEVRDAQRDLEKAQRDVTTAVRDQRRELEDLNAELRRGSLDEADALLNLQESADRLKQGGFKTITEYQRAQVRFLRDIEGLKDVRKNNIRLLEDTNDANQKGIEQGDKVVGALDKVTSAVDRLNEAQKKNDGLETALGKLSPNARRFVEAAYGMKSAWDDLRRSVQDNLFEGLDRSLSTLATRSLPTIKVGLSQVASGLNANVKAAIDSVASEKNNNFWERIFGNTDTALQNMKRGIDPLITGFSRLSDVGASFLPRIGDAFAKVFTDFDKWTAKIANDGTLSKWIDQGLDSLTSLGRAAKNIGSIISSVGEAFNTASGTQGGFIGSLERVTKRLADYLSGEGKQKLVDYFTRAKELITTVKDAFGDMRPLIKQIVEAARNFSTILLPIVGGLAKMAQWVEENARLVSMLFYSYATWRTINPIIDGITNSWKNYNKVVGAAAKFGPTADMFTKVNNGLVQFKSNISAVGGVSAGAAANIKPFTGQLSDAAKNAAKLVSPANSAANMITLVGNNSVGAAKKIGGIGSSASTLMGALGGLVKFIGPALGAGALGLALGLAMAGLDKLGEAHDKAKDAANRQREALSGLKTALDEVTGAAGAAAVKKATDIAQQFPMGPVAGGDRNVLNDVVAANIATPSQLIAATLPQNQNLANDIDKKAIDSLTGKIEKSDAWTKYKDKWSEAGVTPRDLALAAKDEPAAMAKVAEAERRVFGKARKDMNPIDRAAAPARTLPSVSDVIAQSGGYNEAAVALYLAKTREQNVQGAAAIQQATRASGGNARLTPQGSGELGKFGANNNEVYLNPEKTIGYVIVTRDPGTLDPSIGTVTKLNDSQWKIELSTDATKNFVEGYATGGLIGGKGSGTSDSNLMLASRGEFITRKAAVDHYGPGFFERLNSMQLPKFDAGGLNDPKVPWQEQVGQALGAAGYGASPAQLPSLPPPILGPYAPPSSDPNMGTMKPYGTVVPFGGSPGVPLAPNYTTGAASGDVVAGALSDAARANFTPPPAAAPAAPPPPPPPPAAGVPAPASPAAAPFDPLHSGTGPLPGPVSASAPDLTRVMAISRATGIPPGIVMRFSGGIMGGGARTPYAGLAKGTNISYGGEGFPPWVYSIASRFGLQASTYAGHQERDGTNKGIDFSGAPENMRAFAEYVKNVPGLEQVIFQDPRDGARIGVDPGDRGPNQTIDDYYRNDWAGHNDHVHIRTSMSIPTPEELAAGGGLAGIMSAAGIPGMSIPGSPAGKVGKGNGLQNLIDYWTNQEWLQPENVDKFLQGTAKNVGSSLLGIGLNFLNGITGIDLSSIVGYGQEIGNFIGDKAKGTDGSSDATSLNGLTDSELSAFTSGDLSLGMTGGLDGLLGMSPSDLGGLTGLLGGGPGGAAAFNPSGGSEQWRPVVRRVLETFAPQYGIKNIKAWEDAVITQIATESGGNPGSVNPNDSNGKGGTQRVAGILNFLEETFNANNITGGSFMDPVAQIAALIPYVINKYGMNPDGSPRQIGKPGVGFARGGKIAGFGGPRGDKNIIRVSRGEFLHNAKAVNHYGADFLARLNNRQIPKEMLPGFADGMWWDPNQPIPTPAPAPSPAPVPPPALAPAGPPQADGQVPGPLPLDGAAPSTGGAPGPGATAPAPDPGALPAVQDAMAGIGGSIGGLGNLAQPGATPENQSDPRGTLGAAPTSQEHTLPAISGAISGAASAIGSIASMAAKGAIAGGTMGGGAAIAMAPGAGGAMDAGIQAGAQMAGAVVNGAVNILSSLLVGTATGGSTSSASGVPLLPQRQQMQSGVPAMNQPGRVHNGDIYVTNLDDYRRTQERMDAQAAMPYIGKY